MYETSSWNERYILKSDGAPLNASECRVDAGGSNSAATHIIVHVKIVSARNQRLE